MCLLLVATLVATACDASRSGKSTTTLSAEPPATTQRQAAPAQTNSAQLPSATPAAPAPSRVAVTMAEFESDFADLFPSPTFLAARGIEEVVATTQGLERGRPVGAASRITRRYDADGKLTYSEEHDGREPIWVKRITRIDATHTRESLEHAIRKTTAIEDVTTDAAGREQARVSERSTERFFYDNDKLVRATLEEDKTSVKRFRYDGSRLIGMTIEEGGNVLLEEGREYDAAGRETRRTTQRGAAKTTPLGTPTPVEVRAEYDSLGRVASIAVHEGKPILKRTLRYQGELLVEERTQSFVPAVGSAITTFSYKKRRGSVP